MDNKKIITFVVIGVAVVFLGIAALGVGGFLFYRYSGTGECVSKPLKEQFPQQVGSATQSKIDTNVTAEMKKDSLEAYVANYKSSNDKQITFVLIQFATPERAKQAYDEKIKSLQEGISRATVAEKTNKTDCHGKTSGEEAVLKSSVMEQVLWHDGTTVGLVTAGQGLATEFARSLPK